MQTDTPWGTSGSNRDGGGRAPQDEDEEAGFKVFDRRCSAQASSDDLARGTEPVQYPSYVEQLRQQLNEKDTQLREYIAAYKKEVVENLEQTKQRLARDAEQQTKALRAQIAEPMVEVLDALERSLAASQTHSDVKTIYDGVELVRSMLVQRLGLLGLERINTVDQPFDPRVHEAVAVIPVREQTRHNCVEAELSAGFTLDGRVVRAAKVQVGKWMG
ncbi:MAG: nucleotide exchange factor GrpE [Proteobacteria bacterium]|nr:nucleotide exchange factor GrpE [Pseudomonadota bacterium]